MHVLVSIYIIVLSGCLMEFTPGFTVLILCCCNTQTADSHVSHDTLVIKLICIPYIQHWVIQKMFLKLIKCFIGIATSHFSISKIIKWFKTFDSLVYGWYIWSDSLPHGIVAQTFPCRLDVVLDCDYTKSNTKFMLTWKMRAHNVIT
jgi:hypothetical protein